MIQLWLPRGDLVVEKRHTISTIVFLIFCSSVSIFSFVTSGGKKIDIIQTGSQVEFEANQESFFKDVSYYILKNSEKFLHLDAVDLTVNNQTQKTIFISPKGMVYDKNKTPINYESTNGVYYKKIGRLFLNDNVVVKTENTKVASQKMTYFMNEEKLVSEGDVKTNSYSPADGDKITINAAKMTSWPHLKKSEYEGNVVGEIKRKRVYEENMKFKANKIDMDLSLNEVNLYENVSLKKQRLTALGERGEIYLENYNKKLKYFAIYDDVKVTEMVMLKGSSYQRKAYAEKLEGVMSENKIVLTGYPKVYQLKDVIKGNKIILRENNEVIEVDDANTSVQIKN